MQKESSNWGILLLLRLEIFHTSRSEQNIYKLDATSPIQKGDRDKREWKSMIAEN